MSSLISNIVANTGKAPDPVVLSDIPAELVERESNQYGVHKSSPLGPMVVDARYSDLGRVSAVDAGSPETAALMNELDPADQRLFKHLRYYAQTDKRRGFTYTYTASGNEPAEVVFDTGVLVTRERALVESLNHDIKRSGGIGGYVQEISASVYDEMRSSAERYAQLRAISGPLNSAAIDPHQQLRDAEKRQQNEEINALRKQLRDMELVLSQLSPEAREQLMQKSGERAALMPAARADTETQTATATQPVGGSIFGAQAKTN